jgi:hypothetical protein
MHSCASSLPPVQTAAPSSASPPPYAPAGVQLVPPPSVVPSLQVMDAQLGVPTSLPMLAAPTPLSNSTAPHLFLWAPAAIDDEELAPHTPLHASTPPAPSTTPQPTLWLLRLRTTRILKRSWPLRHRRLRSSPALQLLFDEGEGIAMLAASNGLSSGGMFSPTVATPRPHL